MTDAPKASTPFKTILGAVEVINTEKRTVSVVDVDGISNLMKWGQGYLDEKMGKLKESYYREFSCEVQGEDLRITSIKYLESPDWVKQRFKGKGGSSGKSYAPRNEKPMIFESVFKSCCDQASLNPFDWDKQTYEQKMDRIWVVAKKISLEIVQLSGA